MKTRALTIGFLTAATLVVGGASHAGDVKIFSGSACKPVNAPPSGETGYGYNLGLFESELPGWDVTCPIDRDVNASTTGFKLSLYGDPGAGPLACTAFIRRITVATDTFVDFATRSSPAGAEGVVKLDWGTSLNVGAADAVYYLECHVDVYGLISGYRVDEI